MQRAINYLKDYMIIVLAVLSICAILAYSLSYFIVTISNKRAAEMYIGELEYVIEINNVVTNSIVVPPGETIIDISIANINDINTYYKLVYDNNENITINYFDKIIDTNENTTTFKTPMDLIKKSSLNLDSINNLKLKILNNSSNDQKILFKVIGGYATNTLDDIEIPNDYSNISKEESNEAYFCTTSETLIDGLEYINDGLIYKYKNQVDPNSSVGWNNIDDNGWGVKLIDNDNTKPISNKLCTYIDNKPIKSLSYTFYKSKSQSIDLSNFNTKNVTNMESMFESSEVTTIYANLNFDTNNVLNDTNMFLNTLNIIGGNGTKYNENYIDKTYARIDESLSPGYFTSK